MDTRKVTLGAFFLFVSSVTTVEAGLVSPRTPFVAAAIASLALALGSMTLGTVTKVRSI